MGATLSVHTYVEFTGNLSKNWGIKISATLDENEDPPTYFRLDARQRTDWTDWGNSVEISPLYQSEDYSSIELGTGEQYTGLYFEFIARPYYWDDPIRSHSSPYTNSSSVRAGFGDSEVIGSSDSNTWVGTNGGNDTVSGNGGNDFLRGGQGSDEIFGGTGSDSLFGDHGNDTLAGNGGRDWLKGGQGRDALSGGGNNDKLLGGSGGDKLYGQSGNDLLEGGAGRDRLFGGKGNDKLDGDGGNDRMTGNGGNDTFIFSAGDDVVTDFNAASSVDRVDLRGVASITDFDDLMDDHVSHANGNVIIDDLNGNTMTLEGTSLNSLGADDFIF